ncbi:MAG: amidophosphoribosyltransferase [Eubacterium ventriosum]
MSHMDTRMSWEPDKPHEECGVFGMYDLDGNDVASSIYYGLFALQHRGQESCGIAVSDTFGPRKVDLLKGMGLVNEVFNQENIASLKGNIGVGHCRYSTAGESIPSNAQPLVINYVKGTLMLAHNGNLINANELREELAYTGAIFQTTIDSEVIAYHIARERIKTKTAEQAVVNAMKKIKGAYALVVSSPRKLIGARDPYGFKPLCIGKRDNAYILASETCALDTIDAECVRDVEPGAVVVIDKDGINSDKSLCLKPEEQARCVFEYIYFARPDSNFDGTSVYHSRIMAGKFLAMDSPVDADIVVGVPESGNAAAMGYAMQSGIPYGTAFVKNAYVGRTFIKPQQKSRESSVRVKLNVLKEAVNGKRVVMIDDSIVRGTTSDRIVQMLKDAGATEVHVRISSPPFISECYFGTDVPNKEQLIAHNRTIEDIRQVIGSDSLAYLSIDRLIELSGGKAICKGCFTGEYPMEPPTEDIRGEYDK